MIYILFFGTLCSVLINYKIAGNDYFYPPVLYSFMFLISSLICLINVKEFDINLSASTVLVILVGIIVFSIVGLCFQSYPKKRNLSCGIVEPLPLKTSWIIVILVIQFISIIFFIKYLNSLTNAYASAGYPNVPHNLSGKIGLYDNLTKFWKTIFNELSVRVPFLYSITNPIAAASEYLVIYISINNYFATKHVNKFAYLVLLLMIARILLNGSRTPLFRVVTFALFLFFYFSYKTKKIKLGSLRLLGYISMIAIGCLIVFYLLQYVIGRKIEDINFRDQLFIYAGAPIVNLNSFINNTQLSFFSGAGTNILIGEQTFKNLYAYLMKLFGISYRIPYILNFNYSDNGIEIGNVYTMFHTILYDFGYFGVLWTVIVEASYYCYFYNKVMFSSIKKGVNLALLVLAYLFNDLIMSIFSNRFYGTILDAPFLKMLVILIILTFFVNYNNSKKINKKNPINHSK